MKTVVIIIVSCSADCMMFDLFSFYKNKVFCICTGPSRLFNKFYFHSSC